MDATSARRIDNEANTATSNLQHQRPQQLTQIHSSRRSMELLSPAPTRLADAMAVAVVGLLVVAGVFLGWVLLAPNALDILK